jgi:hypothetical protein
MRQVFYQISIKYDNFHVIAALYSIQMQPTHSLDLDNALT